MRVHWKNPVKPHFYLGFIFGILHNKISGLQSLQQTIPLLTLLPLILPVLLLLFFLGLRGLAILGEHGGVAGEPGLARGD